MRHQDLRRPRGIESLWLRLRFLVADWRPGPASPRAGDLSRLSDRQLEDIGLRRGHSRPSVALWRIRG